MPRSYRRWSRLVTVLSYVPVSRNWYKSMLRLYKNSHIYIIWPTESRDQTLNTHWWKFWSRDTDKSRFNPFLWLYLLKINKYCINYNKSVSTIPRYLWVSLIFSIVPFLLNMICLKLWFIYHITFEFWYNFDTV